MEWQGVKMLVVLFCAIALAVLVRATPEWSFDVVCYDGVARIWLGETPAQAHANVYRELASTAPSADAHAITSLSEYRETVATSVEAFMVQLPIAAVKPLYVLLVAAVVKFGGNGIAAAFQISAVAYGCFAALVLLSLIRVTSFWPAMSIGLALLLSPPFLEVGRLPTPDALSACIVFAGFHALVVAGWQRVGATLLLLSIAARPNNLILWLAVASWCWWRDRSARRSSLLGGGLGTVVYLSLNRLTGGYSWGVLFTHAYIRRLTDVASVRSDVTWSRYADTLLPGLAGANVLYPSGILFFVVVSALGFLTVRNGRNSVAERSAAGLVLFLWSALLVHFVAFPMLADRFFMSYYTCITVLTVSMVASVRKAGDLPGVAGAIASV
jgi:hypothetical protein